ncbi:glycosyl transferase [uncultured Methanobrevibacter sp.]|uniref:glycosyl transferase n=1 Tax=uncultured Methanobrevibacter sp. TaxID=253161 RepID=UPI0025E6C68F|nr:glycosyl transferase [uncultured Methanobrevibacter sp.]
MEYELSLKYKEIDDLKNDLELRKVELDELLNESMEKDKKISILNNNLMKYKFEKEKVDLKLKNEINYEKSRMKEMDDLEKKINEKVAIIDDKQDQINYLRTLINDYKEQVKNNTDNLELQLKKITRTYDNLLAQKDSIIEKQDKTIEEMIESAKQLAKDNNATITSLELQIGNYRELLKKYE